MLNEGKKAAERIAAELKAEREAEMASTPTPPPTPDPVETPVVEKIEQAVEANSSNGKSQSPKEDAKVELSEIEKRIAERNNAPKTVPPSNEEQPKVEAKVEQKPETPKAEPKVDDKRLLELEAEIKRLKAVADDPIIQAINAHKQSGKELKDFFKEVGIVDIDKVKVEDIVREQAKALGLEGDDLEEAVTEELDKDRTRFEKAQWEKKLKDEYLKTQNDKYAEYASKFKSAEANYSKENEEITKINEEASILIDQKVTSGEIDEETAWEIARNPVLKYNDKGEFKGYDIETAIKRVQITKNYDKLIAEAEDRGYQAALKARFNPSVNAPASHASPQIASALDAAVGIALEKSKSTQKQPFGRR